MEPSDLHLFGFVRLGPQTWILQFNYPTNPLSMNGSRGNRYTKAKKTREVRDYSTTAARRAKIPALQTCTAQLTQWVTVNRTRDLDNFGLFEKPLYDGLVTAGVVQDDSPAFMTKPRPEIRHIRDSDGMVQRRCFTLTVTGPDDERWADA